MEEGTGTERRKQQGNGMKKTADGSNRKPTINMECHSYPCS